MINEKDGAIILAIGLILSIVGQTCSQGTCACPFGQVQCGSVCVDISSDPNNCGACGLACLSGQICDHGICINDEYAKELAAKEQNGLSVPIEKTSNQLGKVPSYNSGSEITNLDQQQQPYRLISKNFRNYIIKHYSGAGDVLASIEFLNGINVGNITFVKDGAPLPVSHIDSDIESFEIIHIYYYYSRYSDIFALLDSEKGGSSLVYDTRDPSLSHIEYVV